MRNNLSNRITGLSLLSFLLLFLIIFNSCDDTLSPEDRNDFSFMITVRDSIGNPIEGMRVAAWNYLKLSNGRILGKNGNIKSNFSATTSIRIGVSSNSIVSLIVYDLENQIISKIVNEEKLIAGLYEWQWQVTVPDPIKFYKCNYIARDTLNNELLFADSIYITLYQPDYQASYIGWTSSVGVFKTSKKILFPNLTEQFKSVVYTGRIDPIPLGYATFLDSIRIILVDTIASKWQNIAGSIHNGRNEFEVVWNPADSLTNVLNKRIEAEQSIYLKRLNKLTNESYDYPWALYQNYPNPFN